MVIIVLVSAAAIAIVLNGLRRDNEVENARDDLSRFLGGAAAARCERTVALPRTQVEHLRRWDALRETLNELERKHAIRLTYSGEGDEYRVLCEHDSGGNGAGLFRVVAVEGAPEARQEASRGHSYCPASREATIQVGEVTRRDEAEE